GKGAPPHGGAPFFMPDRLRLFGGCRHRRFFLWSARACSTADQGAEYFILNGSPALKVALSHRGNSPVGISCREALRLVAHFALLGCKQLQTLFEIRTDHALHDPAA